MTPSPLVKSAKPRCSGQQARVIDGAAAGGSWNFPIFRASGFPSNRLPSLCTYVYESIIPGHRKIFGEMLGLCSVKQTALSKEHSGSCSALFSQFGPNSSAEVGSTAISGFRPLARDQARSGSCVPLLQDRAVLAVCSAGQGALGPERALIQLKGSL